MRRPFTIGIGGAHSSVGKTTVAAALLRHLMSHPVCLFRHRPRLGAIKYTKTDLYTTLTDDESLIHQKDKDTARLSEAGAEQVLWIKSPAAGLKDVMPYALERLSSLDCVVIEGNSAIEFTNPDIVIFIAGKSEERPKPSASPLARRADIIISAPASGNMPPVAGTKAKIYAPENFPSVFNDEAVQVIIGFMEEIAKKKETERLLKERAADGGISCAEARKIAEELSVAYRDVGSAADELKIKIRNCELGCF